MSEMTLGEFKARPSLLEDSILKLDSTQVSEQDGNMQIFKRK